MREIKFRAWNAKFDAMYDWQIILDSIKVERLLEGLPGVTVMQYTGLKDKNGVEIYEGDVVNMHYFYEAGGMNGTYESEAEIIGTIAYRPDFAVFVVADKERDYPITEYCQEPTEELEVIGNIYENPELLGKEDARS